MSNLVFAYPWSEWHEALLAMDAAMGEAPQIGGGPAASQRFFSERYPNPAEARGKRLRFEKAMRWLDTHVDEFDSERLGVVGREGALISMSAHRALHLMFSEIADSLLLIDPPDGAVMECATRFAASES